MQLLNRFPLKISIGLAGAVLIALAVVLLTPSPAPAQPVISWVPESLNETVLVGEPKTVSVSFTAAQDLGAVEVRMVPELEPFVRTEPTSFTSVAAGQETSLEIIISAPESASPQVVEGTIQIRNAGRPPRNYARPLPVTINIQEGQRVINEVGGYSVIVPPGFTPTVERDGSTLLEALTADGDVAGVIVIVAHHNSTNVSDFVAQRNSNPDCDDLVGCATLDNATNIIVDGHPALRFGHYGLSEAVIFVEGNNNILEISTIENMVELEGVLSTLQFR